MHPKLPLLLTLIICSSCLTAQRLSFIPFPPFQVPGAGIVNATCTNFAGTYSMGPFYGQSNHHDITDTVFLCLGDSLTLIHNTDYDLSGDPQPLTQPGLASAFYQCPPTTEGPTLTSILADSCVWPNPFNVLYAINGVPNPFDPEIVFNNGYLQEILADSKPFLLYLAPITLDNAEASAFENDIPGGAPGPCVHVNSSVAFPVVYLNGIQVSDKVVGINGNECRGRFRLKGGLPEFAPQTVYNVSVTLIGDTAVHGTLITPLSEIGHDKFVVIDVPKAGIYSVSVEDGKSCGFTFSIIMSNCIPVGTEDLPGQEISIQVLPNPVGSSLRLIRNDFTGKGMFNLYDVAGRLVKSVVADAAVQEIDMENFVQGIYFWQYQVEGITVKNGKMQKL